MRLAALLLAAGAGRRFGACKQLAPLAGKPLLRHALENLATVFTDDLFVVLGAHADEIRPQVAYLAAIIEHDGWEAGLGTSIARGVDAVERADSYDGVLIALADQPALTSDDFGQLLAAFDGNRIVATDYGDRAGVPAVFPAACFARLRQLSGDRGAQAMLQAEADILRIALPAAALDVDRAEDLERLSRC